MRLVWTTPALADRIAIYDHIDVDNPWAAAELDEQFATAAEHLRRHPGMGRTGRLAGTRELIVHPNYILVYAFRGDTVQMLAIVHTARQWPPEHR